MAEILHSLTIKATPGKVYFALTNQKGLASWWTRHARAEAITDSIAEFPFDHGKTNFRMKIIRLIQNKLVMWHCLGGHRSWEGTQISFEIIPEGQAVRLNFAHKGWRGVGGIYPQCNFEWAHYLASLRSYLERGRGFPARD